MGQGLKHLVECHCTLPQFRERREPIYHRFVVFSELDRHDNVIPKHAQCNNCGVIHRVIDVGKTEILTGRDASVSIVEISDIKHSLPESVCSVLETYGVGLPTWEEVMWIFENHSWGSHVILTSEEKDGATEGKCLRFISTSSIRIEPYTIPFLFPGR